MSHTIKDLVTAYGNKVIDNRRYLHAHPELSFQKLIRLTGFVNA